MILWPPLLLAFPLANTLCNDVGMATDHTPDEDSQRIYARHKRHHEAAKGELPAVRERAAKDLLAGSTPTELAKLTGLSDEFFRRIARAVGAERKREPTVGREVEAKRPPVTHPIGSPEWTAAKMAPAPARPDEES